jgi:4-diphosphocytidyl-2-C-methyl-D-erythritol kinase
MKDRTPRFLPNHAAIEKLAPAKLNLFLRITGLRNNGYHEIASLFVPVALYDTLRISKRERGIEVHCSGRKAPRGSANLVHRAATYFFENTGIDEGAEVRLTKNIPVASGLGGGSSDAAATLLGLNQLWGNPLKRGELEKIALCLGADVPFFLLCRPAVARGIGEILRPIEGLPSFWYVIVSSPIMVSTAWAYSEVKLELTNKADLNKIYSFEKADINIPDMLSNDLESVTFGKHPFLRSIKTSLIELGALGSLMSGSGPSIFGLFNSEKKAQEAGKILASDTRGDVFVVKGLNETSARGGLIAD